MRASHTPLAALLFLVACSPATPTPQAQAPQTVATPSATYGTSAFCQEASNVLNYRPEPTSDPRQTAELARQHAKGWEELANTGPANYADTFSAVSRELTAAADSYEKAALDGLKAPDSSLEKAREASLRLVNAWDAAAQAIEQECGWPATEGDRLDLSIGAGSSRSVALTGN